jgi:uncharacterized OsmC-like protein
MFQLTLDGSRQYDVHFKNQVIRFASDESAPNPLAATFAAIAGCAGVYANKACKAMGISTAGIAIECKPVMRGGELVIPARFVTEVTFPDHFTAEQRQHVLTEIAECAVKKMIHIGNTIEFDTHEKV